MSDDQTAIIPTSHHETVAKSPNSVTIKNVRGV